MRVWVFVHDCVCVREFVCLFDFLRTFIFIRAFFVSIAIKPFGNRHTFVFVFVLVFALAKVALCVLPGIELYLFPAMPFISRCLRLFIWQRIK